MMKRMSLLVVLFSILCAPGAFAADRLRVAYSSISAAYTGIWVAHDAGFFAKEGLENQIIFIGSATQLAQVLVAGDVDIAPTATCVSSSILPLQTAQPDSRRATV